MVTKSHAVKIWLLVIIAVLVVLYIETSGPARPAYNVVVSAEKGTEGFDVIVDGKPEAKLESGKNSGIDGSVAWLTLSNGKHTVELSSQGKPIKTRQIEVSGKEYLRFE